MINKNTLRKLLKPFFAIQLFNAFMDFALWFTIGYHIPSWTIATLNVFYVTLIFALEKAK